MRKLILVGAVAAAIAACASAPQRSEQVEQARAQVQTLSQDPLAQQAAGKDLEAARKALQTLKTRSGRRSRRESWITTHIWRGVMRRLRGAGVGSSFGQEVARAQEDRNKILMESDPARPRARRPRRRRLRLSSPALSNSSPTCKPSRRIACRRHTG